MRATVTATSWNRAAIDVAATEIVAATGAPAAPRDHSSLPRRWRARDPARVIPLRPAPASRAVDHGSEHRHPSVGALAGGPAGCAARRAVVGDRGGWATGRHGCRLAG